jgi:hypothetical protein
MGHMGQGILKADTDLVRKAAGNAVAQPRRKVRFVCDDGNLARAEHHRDGNKPALAKDNVRPDIANQFFRLKISFDYAEGSIKFCQEK